MGGGVEGWGMESEVGTDADEVACGGGRGGWDGTAQGFHEGEGDERACVAEESAAGGVHGV